MPVRVQCSETAKNCSDMFGYVRLCTDMFAFTEKNVRFKCGVLMGFPNLLQMVWSLAPAHSALAGLWLRPDPFRHVGSFTPLSQPCGLRLWRILFATSQAAQIPSCSNPGGSSPIPREMRFRARQAEWETRVASALEKSGAAWMANPAEAPLALAQPRSCFVGPRQAASGPVQPRPTKNHTESGLVRPSPIRLAR